MGMFLRAKKTDETKGFTFSNFDKEKNVSW